MAALGIGIDLIDVHDVEDALARFGPRYLQRVFTPAEIAAARGGSDATCLAMCFAAKEATMKALAADNDGILWRSIEVDSSDTNAVSLRLHGAAAATASRRGVTTLQLSVTHTRAHAAAIVLAVGCRARRGTVEGEE